MAVGKESKRSPPSEVAIKRARARVAKASNISAKDADAKHAAGKWRYNIVKTVQKRCSDPDTVLGDWLEHVAPMGITERITPGGIFPCWPLPAEATLLDDSFWTRGNHPSFGLTYRDDTDPPWLGLLNGS